jgi:sulfotransferase family protein
MERTGEVAGSTSLTNPDVPRRTRVLYIGGAGRSGSTLLERALSELPGVVASGELRVLWRALLTSDRRCACGDEVSACPFWQEVGQRAFGGWRAPHLSSLLALQRSVDRHRQLPRLVGRSISPPPGVEPLSASWATVLRSIAETASARLVIDSSKYPVHAAVLRRSEELDLRVVHLVRDPRGVAHSWAKRGILKPDSTDGRTYMHVFGHGRSAVEWITYNLAFQRIRNLGTPTLLLRYESFVRDPVEALSRTLTFAGLPFEPANLSFLAGDRITLGRREQHAIGGNPDRFQGETSILLELDDAWRRDMPAFRRGQVSLLAWPLMRRYGYARQDTRRAG